MLENTNNTLVITLDNSGSAIPAQTVTVRAQLPEGLSMTEIPVSTTCDSAWSLNANDTRELVFETEGVSASNICELSFEFRAELPGVFEFADTEVSATTGTTAAHPITISVGYQTPTLAFWTPTPIAFSGQRIPVDLEVYNDQITQIDTSADFELSFPSELEPDNPINIYSICSVSSPSTSLGQITFESSDIPSDFVCRYGVGVSSNVPGEYIMVADGTTLPHGPVSPVTLPLIFEEHPSYAFEPVTASQVTEGDNVTATLTVTNEASTLSVDNVDIGINWSEGLRISQGEGADDNCAMGQTTFDESKERRRSLSNNLAPEKAVSTHSRGQQICPAATLHPYPL